MRSLPIEKKEARGGEQHEEEKSPEYRGEQRRADVGLFAVLAGLRGHDGRTASRQMPG